MEILLAVVAGVLYATGLFLMLRRRLAQLIIGLGLLSNGRISYSFRCGCDAGEAAAHSRSAITAEQFVDPVPQSLILTAIVIGFGVLAFSLVLAHRVTNRPARTTSTPLDPTPPRLRRTRRIGVMLLVLPIVLPLSTAIALHLLPKRSRLLRVAAFLGALLLLAAGVSVLVRVHFAGIQVLQVGSWPAPLGITLVADLFRRRRF